MDLKHPEATSYLTSHHGASSNPRGTAPSQLGYNTRTQRVQRKEVVSEEEKLCIHCHLVTIGKSRLDRNHNAINADPSQFLQGALSFTYVIILMATLGGSPEESGSRERRHTTSAHCSALMEGTLRWDTLEGPRRPPWTCWQVTLAMEGLYTSFDLGVLVQRDY